MYDIPNKYKDLLETKTNIGKLTKYLPKYKRVQIT